MKNLNLLYYLLPGKICLALFISFMFVPLLFFPVCVFIYTFLFFSLTFSPFLFNLLPFLFCCLGILHVCILLPSMFSSFLTFVLPYSFSLAFICYLNVFFYFYLPFGYFFFSVFHLFGCSSVLLMMVTLLFCM